MRQRTCPTSAPNFGRARNVLVDRPDGVGVAENNGSARVDDYAGISKNTVSIDYHVVERGLPEALYDRINVEPLLRGASSSCAHLLFDRDISDRAFVMFAIDTSDEGLRIVRLRQVEPENRFRNLALANKRLENRRSLKARKGLVSQTQETIRGRIGDVEARHAHGRAKCLSSSLVIEVVSYLSVGQAIFPLAVYPARLTTSVYCSTLAQAPPECVRLTDFPTCCAVELCEGSYSLCPWQDAPQATSVTKKSLLPVSICTVYHGINSTAALQEMMELPVNVWRGVPTVIGPYHRTGW